MTPSGVPRVALATCRHALPGATGPGANPDVDAPLLLDALERSGIEGSLEVWNDVDVAWESFDAVVVRSTWDYTSQRERFLEWASERRRLFNHVSALEYSSDKHYLSDLASRGVPVVTTRMVEVGEDPQFFDGRVVVKPAVGAGSADAAQYGDTDEERRRAREHVTRLHQRGAAAVVQPYVDSVDEVGERALVFIDGEFSHALTKGAMLTVPEERRDAAYRRARMSGALADDEALETARRVLEVVPDTLYARVDLVRVRTEWRVMELELVEPNLFLSYSPDAAARFARALDLRLS